MQNGLVSLLSSYDIFGKSIPGTVFFLGIISLFPASLNGSSPAGESTGAAFTGIEILSELSPRAILPIIALALFLGLIFGEGVHTFAVNSERFVAWLGRIMYSSLSLIRRIFPELYQYLSSDIDYTKISERESSFYDQLQGVIDWFKRRYYGATDAFVGHRRLFAINCLSNYGDEPGRRKEDEPKHIYEKFQTRFDEIFDRELPKEGEEELMEVYPLVTSVVTQSGSTQYRRFQAIYSFCRSMWVSLALIAAGHAIILFFKPAAYPNSTLGATLFTQLSIPPIWLPVGLGSSVLFFIDATGTYKRHYVEYLVAEFALSGEMKKNNDPEHEEDDNR